MAGCFDQSRRPFDKQCRGFDARLDSVLAVISLLFNEGYTATSGDDWMRPALCKEAMRLGRILCGHMPERGEVRGLTALIELQTSRLRARLHAAGRPVLLLPGFRP